ncbi:zinc finger, CCHC-type containing protein [Tanacetum coccineum]
MPELTKDHKGNKPIRRIQKKAIRRIEDIVCEDSGRYQSWSLLQETLIRRLSQEFKPELPQGCLAVVRLLDPKLKTLGERGIECIFVGYDEHSKGFSGTYQYKTANCYGINSQSDYSSDGWKTSFLNGELDEERAPKQWHQKFDEVVLSNGYLLNKAEKCVYSKFDETGKGVIIFLYLDDMLIFGTNQVQVDLTKEYLSSRFSIKDMWEADVIFGIRIKHESNGIAISQSHYIEKVLKKFNYFDCTLVSTPMDTSKKLMPNNGHVVSQLEYSRVIDRLMYVMTYTRPDIAFAVGKLILEGYTNASWINNAEDNSSTRGWVFLLGRGAIFWASKKQTCITSSTMESEFVALAAAGKEAEWLRNMVLEIPLRSKPIAPISIRYDSAVTLAKAYSQMYNRKSRYFGVRHSMIRELIMNGVVFIEFVRSQQNLAYHLTKGLARDLVIKSAEGMGLNGLKQMYLHIIPRMRLEPAEKEDEFIPDNGDGGIHQLMSSAKAKGSHQGVTPQRVNIIRGGIEAQQLAHLQNLVGTSILSNSDDRWVCNLNGDGSFQVKNIRCLLDEYFLPNDPVATRWVKFIPIKINVFAWRVYLDRLPTRLNLNRRNIQVLDQSCPVCKDAAEEVSHLFFSCPLAVDVHRLICRWWNLTWSPLSSYEEWLSWFKDIRLGYILKCMLEGIFYVSWWSIWNYRNNVLFAAQPPRKDIIFDDIVTHSFLWCHARYNKAFSWDRWLQHPYLLSL